MICEYTISLSPGMLHLAKAPFSPFKDWMQDMWQKYNQGLRFKI